MNLMAAHRRIARQQAVEAIGKMQSRIEQLQGALFAFAQRFPSQTFTVDEVMLRQGCRVTCIPAEAAGGEPGVESVTFTAIGPGTMPPIRFVGGEEQKQCGVDSGESVGLISPPAGPTPDSATNQGDQREQ